jgi:transcriptional regulator with XRE-family HTH domain
LSITNLPLPPQKEALMSLKDFVRETMSAKNLSGVEIQKRSDNKITDSYISKIVNGQVKRPSAIKLKALALGLGVDESELFRAVGEPVESETWTATRLVFVMQRVLESRELRIILHRLVSMKPQKLKAVLSLLEKEKPN